MDTTQEKEIATHINRIKWNLSEIAPNKRSILLCNGYIRTESVGLTKSSFIINLCADYYETQTISNIFKTFPRGHYICSPIFSLAGFKWIFKFYPHKFSLKHKKCHVTVELISYPSSIYNVEANFVFELMDDNTIICHNKLAFNLHQAKVNTLEFDVRTITKLISPAFIISCDVNHINSANGINVQHVMNPSIETISNTYKWIIKDTSKIISKSAIKTAKILESPLIEMIGFKWYLHVTKEGSLYISCPCISNSLSKISIVCEIIIQEIDPKYKYIACLSFKNRYDDRPKKISLEFDKIPYSEYKSVVIKIKLILTDVYKKEHTPITSQYLLNKSSYHCTETPMESFVWHVFKANMTAKDLYLCTGYIRQFNMTENVVDNIIITTCCKYYGYCNLNNIMKTIKHQKHSRQMYSQIFVISSLKWVIFIEIKKLSILLKFMLVVLPQNINCVNVKWNITCCQTNEMFCSHAKLANGNHQTMRLTDNTIKHLDTLTFKADIHVLEVQNKEKNSIENHHLLLNKYLYTVTDYIKFKMYITYNKQIQQKQMKCWVFEMFGIKWCLKVENDMIYLSNVSCSVKLPNFLIFYTFICSEINVNKSAIIHFRQRVTGSYSKTQYVIFQPIKFEDFNLNEFTFDLKMILVDAYSETSNCLMNKCINNKPKTRQIKPIMVGEYEWKLPCMNKTERKIVCNGYCRNVTQQYIPLDVIKLCFIFVGDEIKNPEIFTVKNSNADEHGFTAYDITNKSNIFTIGSFKFYLVFARDQYHKAYCGIHLVSLSPHIQYLLTKLYVKIEILPVDESVGKTEEIDSTIEHITHSDIHNQLWSASFDINHAIKGIKVKMGCDILDISDKDGETVLDY
eukprot:415343_1